MATVKAAHYPCSTALAPLAQRAAVAALLMALALAGCGKPETVRQPPPPSRDWSGSRPNDPVAANAVLMRAIGLVGTPYRYGGNTPDTGFDCSGLIGYVYRDVTGISLPRTTREMISMQAANVGKEGLQTGDLIFFATNGGSQVSHAGIYVGEGRFVHAPATGGTVKLDSLSKAYWQKTYLSAKRVLQPEHLARNP